jgi:hypothetical protein
MIVVHDTTGSTGQATLRLYDGSMVMGQFFLRWFNGNGTFFFMMVVLLV